MQKVNRGMNELLGRTGRNPGNSLLETYKSRYARTPEQVPYAKKLYELNTGKFGKGDNSATKEAAVFVAECLRVILRNVHDHYDPIGTKQDSSKTVELKTLDNGKSGSTTRNVRMNMLSFCTYRVLRLMDVDVVVDNKKIKGGYSDLINPIKLYYDPLKKTKKGTLVVACDENNPNGFVRGMNTFLNFNGKVTGVVDLPDDDEYLASLLKNRLYDFIYLDDDITTMENVAIEAAVAEVRKIMRNGGMSFNRSEQNDGGTNRQKLSLAAEYLRSILLVHNRLLGLGGKDNMNHEKLHDVESDKPVVTVTMSNEQHSTYRTLRLMGALVIVRASSQAKATGQSSFTTSQSSEDEGDDVYLTISSMDNDTLNTLSSLRDVNFDSLDDRSVDIFLTNLRNFIHLNVDDLIDRVQKVENKND